MSNNFQRRFLLVDFGDLCPSHSGDLQFPYTDVKALFWARFLFQLSVPTMGKPQFSTTHKRDERDAMGSLA